MKMLSPRRDASSFTVERNHYVSSRIPSLFFASSPPDIIRFISLVVVNSFKRVTRRGTCANVGIECFKRINPLRANHDSPFQVIFRALGLRIKASLLHAQPNIVFRAIRQSVRAVHLCGSFASKATARAGHTPAQITRLNNRGTAAVTQAKPIGSLSDLMVKSLCRKASESIVWLYNQITQDVNLHRQVSFWSGSCVATNNVRAVHILA